VQEPYKLTSIFYAALAVYGLALLWGNKPKIGYLANAIVSGTSFFIMRDFREALGPTEEGPTVQVR
jgi:hypothetical protein